MNKIFTFVLLVFTLTSCLEKGAEVETKYYEDQDYEVMSRTINLPESPYDYTLKTPNYISAGFFGQTNNKAEATLGRVLFYDKNLSKDGKVSCATCHKQELAFSDDVAFSNGPNGKVTTRNSIALGSVLNFSVYYGDERFGRVPFFWDNSATTVQEQAERTLANPNEMDMDMHEVVGQVKKLDYYGPLFEKAYQTKDITNDKVLNAISSFVNAIPAYNTKWDAELSNHFTKYNKTTDLINYDFAGFSAVENQGKKIYLQKCASCHGEAIGAPSQTRANNGLATSYTDNGIGAISKKSDENGLFKVTTLRNILLTAPYMHDGSLATIDDVLDHYSNGVQNHPNLHKNLKSNGQPMKMNLSSSEREAIKAFFGTLTDYALLSDPRFSDPFKN